MRSIPLIANIESDERDAWLTQLNTVLPDTEVRPSEQFNTDQAANADVAIVANPSPDELRRFTGLRWVQSVWAGVEKMVKMPELAQIPIVRMEDPELARTMGEAVLAWTLYLHRDMPEYARQQKEKIWQQRPYTPPHECEVGVLGSGKLGRAAIEALLTCGFRVSAWSRSEQQIDGVAHYAGLERLPALLARCDILVSLLPLTAETEHLMDAQRLALLKPQAAIINFARGAIFDEQALLRQLDQGALRHAVLDVFSTEPLPPDNPFWHHPAVTVLPHISAPTNVKTASLIVRDNLQAYQKDGTIPPAVNYRRGY
jgi:glyoxylate/hydroxypyruvate reductase A